MFRHFSVVNECEHYQQNGPSYEYDVDATYEEGSKIILLTIEIAIRKNDPFLFLLKIHMYAARFSTAKTAVFATAILKSAAKETRVFPIRIVGFTVQKTIEATSAMIVMATRLSKILCCRSRRVQLIRLPC
jgi:hypothetical protein